MVVWFVSAATTARIATVSLCHVVWFSDHYGEDCYCIPVGGSCPKAVFAFLHMFQELLDQGLHENFDDIVVTIATGGTATGLALANYLTGSKLKYATVIK